MNSNSLELLVERLGLGEISNKPCSLSGGALHSMLHVKTSAGEYAIKVINPHIQEKPEFPDNYNLTEQVAEHFSKLDIPAVHAISFDNKYVVYADEQAFIIYPYVSGKILLSNQVNTRHGENVGELFSKIHSANLELEGCDKPDYITFTNSHWKDLLSRSGNEKLIDMSDFILASNDRYNDAVDSLNNKSVLTHRDMHYKNMLWDGDDNPFIIDWESAGLMNPYLEVIGYALEWSGVILEQCINFNLFDGIYSKYLESISAQEKSMINIEQSYYGWLGHCVLGWTEFNIRRMLGETSDDKSEHSRGKEIIVSKMIPTLEYLQHEQQNIINHIKSL